MIYDLLAAIGVLILLGVVMLIAKLCYKRLTPEGSRKTIHIVMGCTALAFPYIFEYRQTVIYLGIVAILLLLLMRRNKVLHKQVGIALLGVQRKTLGDIYFVISIVIVFALHQNTFEYLMPIAILTFADSIAALIGTSYGRYNMAQHEEDAKSREGSLMFFIVAFICALIPLQLMTEVGRAEVLVISFLIGMLAAMIEAVTRNGNDNLMLPILTYSILHYNIEQPLEMILANFGIMLLLFVVIFVVYKNTNMTRLSIVYSLLVGYIIVILGGASWILPPLVLLLTFGVLPTMKENERNMLQTYKVVESNTVIGITCLVLTGFFPEYRDVLYLSFSLSFAIHLATNTCRRLINFENSGIVASATWGLLKAIAFIALPTLAITKMNWLIFTMYLATMVITLPFAVSLNKRYNYKKVGSSTNNANIILVGGWVAIFTSALVILGEFYDLFG
jgi:phytol kinase